MKKLVIASACIALALSSQLAAQNLAENEATLKQQLSLCEARYDNNGFNSALAFLVGCVNPAFEAFFTASNAAPFMYESVKAQSLTIGAKVDAGEMELKAGVESIFAVFMQSVTFLRERNSATVASETNQAPQPSSAVDVEAIKRLCSSRAVAARDALAIQYDNQWLVFLQNNPMPTSVSTSQQIGMVLNNQLNTADVVAMDMRRQEQQQLWQQRIAQSRALHDKQKQNAVGSTYTNTNNLCLREHGL